MKGSAIVQKKEVRIPMQKSLRRALFIVAVIMLPMAAAVPPAAQACYECTEYGCRVIKRQTNPGAPPGSRCWSTVTRCCDEYGCYDVSYGAYCE
jgi:hypothetical protein